MKSLLLRAFGKVLKMATHMLTVLRASVLRLESRLWGILGLNYPRNYNSFSNYVILHTCVVVAKLTG